MYGIGADGEKGLRRILDIIKDELSTALGLVGLTDISDVTSEIIAKKFIAKYEILILCQKKKLEADHL
jgi:L-lactate dehydrogenase (cytochrome)